MLFLCHPLQDRKNSFGKLLRQHSALLPELSSDLPVVSERVVICVPHPTPSPTCGPRRGVRLRAFAQVPAQPLPFFSWALLLEHRWHPVWCLESSRIPPFPCATLEDVAECWAGPCQAPRGDCTEVRPSDGFASRLLLAPRALLMPWLVLRSCCCGWFS